MKLYGHPDEKCNDVINGFIKIEIVELLATSEDLVRLADFIYKCAKKIKEEPEWEHEHLQDSSYFDFQNEDIPFDFVVYALR